jgi:hypothetical protein
MLPHPQPAVRGIRCSAMRRGILVMGMAIVASGGCGPAKPVSNRPQTHPATGKLSLAGQPLAAATVTFRPEGKGSGCAGISDASGGFKLSTFAAGDGALPGKYRVTVTKFAAGPAAPDVNSPDYAPPSASAAPPKGLLPEKYGDPAASGLTAEVVAGKANVFEFDLKP